MKLNCDIIEVFYVNTRNDRRNARYGEDKSVAKEIIINAIEDLYPLERLREIISSRGSLTLEAPHASPYEG